MTFTGAVNGDVWVWQGVGLSRVVSGAHTGPVFAMFTTLEDGLVVSAGKERRYSYCDIIIRNFDLLLLVYSDEGGVKLWDVDMNRSRTFPLGSKGGVVRAVFRSKVSDLTL